MLEVSNGDHSRRWPMLAPTSALAEAPPARTAVVPPRTQSASNQIHLSKTDPFRTGSFALSENKG